MRIEQYVMPKEKDILLRFIRTIDWLSEKLLSNTYSSGFFLPYKIYIYIYFAINQQFQVYSFLIYNWKHTYIYI